MKGPSHMLGCALDIRLVLIYFWWTEIRRRVLFVNFVFLAARAIYLHQANYVAHLLLKASHVPLSLHLIAELKLSFFLKCCIYIGCQEKRHLIKNLLHWLNKSKYKPFKVIRSSLCMLERWSKLFKQPLICSIFHAQSYAMPDKTRFFVNLCSRCFTSVRIVSSDSMRSLAVLILISSHFLCRMGAKLCYSWQKEFLFTFEQEKRQKLT